MEQPSFYTACIAAVCLIAILLVNKPRLDYTGGKLLLWYSDGYYTRTFIVLYEKK